MTDQEREAQIRERVEKATAGPWVARSRHGFGPEADEVAGLGWEVEGPPEPGLRGQYARAADAAFIAQSREDIPWLLDRLAAERDARERAEAHRQQLREAITGAMEAAWEENVHNYRGTDQPRAFMVTLGAVLEETEDDA